MLVSPAFLAISAFTLEALLVIVVGLIACLIFAAIVTNKQRDVEKNRPILVLLALAMAAVVIIGAATWATAFFHH